MSQDLTLSIALTFTHISSHSAPSIVWNSLSVCDQILVQSIPDMELNAFAFSHNVTTAGLIELNDNKFSSGSLSNGSYCAPLSCAVEQVTRDIGAAEFLQLPSHTNITVTQFMAWNPSTHMQVIVSGEVICVG